MNANPNLDVSLSDVMLPQIALPLQILRIYTVGGFLRAWNDPEGHWQIQQVFDSPAQANHAATVCASWIGIGDSFIPTALPAHQWWRPDDLNRLAA